MLLAQAKRQLNQPEGVEQALLDALSVDPEHAEANINLANHFLLSGKPQDALQTIERVLTKSPALLEVMNTKANALRDFT